MCCRVNTHMEHSDNRKAAVLMLSSVHKVMRKGLRQVFEGYEHRDIHTIYCNWWKEKHI